MKVIELLNLISRGRELPNKIKYNGYIFEYDTNHKRYEAYFDEQIWTLQDFINVDDDLNNEVEIIEEPQEHKIPEKIDQWDRKWHYTYYKKEQFNQMQDNIEQLRQKYNKIVDYLEGIE